MDVHSPYRVHTEYRVLENRGMLVTIVEALQKPHRSKKVKASGPIRYMSFNGTPHQGKFTLPSDLPLHILPWQVRREGDVYAAYTAGVCGNKYIGVQFDMPVFIHPPGRLINNVLEDTLVRRIEDMAQPVIDFMDRRFERVAHGYLYTPRHMIERLL